MSFGRHHGGAGISLQPIERTTPEQIPTLQHVEDPRPELDDFTEGLLPLDRPYWRRFILKDCNLWEGLTLEQGKSVRSKVKPR